MSARWTGQNQHMQPLSMPCTKRPIRARLTPHCLRKRLETDVGKTAQKNRSKERFSLPSAGVATHHDGMSGTERQDVTDDYEQRISESHFEVEAGVGVALQKLLDLPPTEKLLHCNCNECESGVVLSHL